MRKKIEEIKTFQNKTTYSHYSKQIKGVFKTIGIESFIKKYEDLQKLKNKNNQIKKISVSDFLDQLDKEKQMNLLKDNKRKFFKSRISVKNKYIDIHKYDDEIDIFSKNYSPPKYIKPLRTDLCLAISYNLHHAGANHTAFDHVALLQFLGDGFIFQVGIFHPHDRLMEIGVEFLTLHLDMLKAVLD